ncbi:MAG TPA: S8 family serine peptidase, partial [Chloroflexia bacterium]|nr:S8 family serine peptidase [Chloroflexia bacterium]
AVRLLPGRLPLSAEAQGVLQRRGAPVMFLPEYGIRVIRAEVGERALQVLDREEAVEFATPVYRRTPENQDPMFVTKRFLVQFKPEVTGEQIAELNARNNVRVAEQLDYAPNGYLLEAPAGTGAASAVSLANIYFETGLAIWSHPDFIKGRETKGQVGGVISSGTPGTGSIGSSNSTGRTNFLTQQWHLAAAKVLDAWNITKGSPEIMIAILDDGLDTSHVEFQGIVKASYDFSRNVTDVTPQTSADSHGTACAGVAVARGKKASGVAPGCSLMAVRTPRYLGTHEEAQMFMWAARNKADVISCSWGTPDGFGDYDPLPDNVAAAIHECVRPGGPGRGGKGIPIFWAAGNGSESVSLDGYASNPDVIAIAASTNKEAKAPYSDFGKEIWVCAPSSGDMLQGDKSIFTTDRTGAPGYNDGDAGRGDVNGDYTNDFGGTSSATPLVAGVAGLMLSVNPSLTAWQVREILKSTADKIGDKNSYNDQGFSLIFGYGRVNAVKGVEAAKSPPVQPAGGATGTVGGTGGAVANSPKASIQGPQSAARYGEPPRFTITLPAGRYYGVEVATQPQLLVDGGDETNFHESWEDGSSLKSASDYLMPMSVWDRLKAASRLYYRLWTSSSATEWVDHETDVPNASVASAHVIEIIEQEPGPSSIVMKSQGAHIAAKDRDIAREDGGSMDIPGLASGNANQSAMSKMLISSRGLVPAFPDIDGPDMLPVGGAAPIFRVLPGTNRYYAVEVTTDPDLFDPSNDMGENEATPNFFGSWQNADALLEGPGVTTYALPDAAWHRLRNATSRRLYYRLITSSNPLQWVNRQTSTQSLPADARYIELVNPLTPGDIHAEELDRWRTTPGHRVQ